MRTTRILRFQTLPDSIQPEDWSRFQYYAEFVRQCHEYAWTRDSLDVSAYIHLFEHNDHKPLLPFLETLTWERELCDPAEDIALRAVLTPSLRNLTLTVKRDNFHEAQQDHALGVILNNVFSTAVHLEKLVLCNLQRWTSLAGVDACKELQHIDLRPSSPVLTTSITDLHRILTSIPALISLSIYCNTSFTFGHRGERTVGPKPTFACLQKLVIRGHPDDILAFLPGASFPCLVHLQLDFERAFPLRDMPSYIGLFRLARIVPNLHRLYISEHTFYGPPHPPEDCSLLELVEPLLALKELDTFEIRLGEYSPRVTDDDIRSIAESLPKLQALRLTFEPSEVRPSLYALNHLARNCPGLKKLTLPPVHHRGDIPDTTLLRPHGLEELVTYGWEVDEEQLERYVAAVFPHVMNGAVR